MARRFRRRAADTLPRLRFRCARVLCLSLGLCFCSLLLALDTDRETRLKAAIIVKLTRFVEWPTNSFATEEAPLRICVLGSTSLVEALQQAEGRVVQGHPLEVLAPGTETGAGDCHVLFVARNIEGRLRGVLDEIRRQPILSISEIDAFAERGGIIGIAQRAGRFSFHVNIDSAQQAGLVVSAPLLELAQIVERGRPLP